MEMLSAIVTVRKAVQNHLNKQLIADEYESCIQPLKLVGVKEHTLYLRTRSELGLKFLKDFYTEKIETALSEIIPTIMKVKFLNPLS
jgi:chromosomal replication initiation ATPase DnaA